MTGTQWKLWTLWSIMVLSIALVIWNTATLGFYESVHWNVALFLIITLAGIIKRRIS